MESLTPTEYRQGANAYILRDDGRLLLVQLNDYAEDEWNVPGGGREDGETLQATAYREVSEEVGINQEALQLLGESSHVLTYNFPATMTQDSIPVALQYKGQQKHQFVFRYDGRAELIVRDDEIRTYRWVSVDELPGYLKFPGQLENALAVLAEFGLAGNGRD